MSGLTITMVVIEIQATHYSNPLGLMAGSNGQYYVMHPGSPG